METNSDSRPRYTSPTACALLLRELCRTDRREPVVHALQRALLLAGCQKAQWTSSVHKEACARIAQARCDTILKAQSHVLARVSRISGSAPGGVLLQVHRQD